MVAVGGLVERFGEAPSGELAEELVDCAQCRGGGVIEWAGVEVLGAGGICEQRDGGGEGSAEGAL